MKIGMKEEMGVADEMTSSVWRAHLCAKRTNSLIFMFFWGKVAARIVRGS